MRLGRINTQTVYYASLIDKEPLVDEYGNATGEYKLIYSAPIKARMNVSAARGGAYVEQFGINNPYERTAVTCDMKCPIDTASIMWIGIEPDENGENGEVKHNYAVITVARSINAIEYALKEVMVG